MVLYHHLVLRHQEKKECMYIYMYIYKVDQNQLYNLNYLYCSVGRFKQDETYVIYIHTKKEITFILLLVPGVASLTISDNMAAFCSSEHKYCHSMFQSLYLCYQQEGRKDVSGMYVYVTHLITLPLQTVPIQFLRI